MTVQDLITESLLALGEISPGQRPSASESARAFSVLNDILSSWTTQHRKVHAIDNLQFPLESGKGSYTLGPGGDFESFRPVKIQAANVVRYDDGDPIGLAKPLELVSSSDWAAIPEKGMEAKQPLKLYNDNQYPAIGLHVWPIPVCS
jgi:hypothetical protein